MKIEVLFTPRFIRVLKKLPFDFQEEVLLKIAEFECAENHERLKAHKLHGRLKNQYSFSVDYRTRIVFEYIKKDQVALLSIGDHDVYQ